MNKLKQMGFGGIEIIVIAVIAAAFLGMWTYYSSQMALLRKDNEEKAAAIKQMAKDNAETLAENTALKVSNDNFVTQVATQNSALEALKKERDDAVERWKDAAKAAEVVSVRYRRRIANIMAETKRAGEDWCMAWKRIVDGYYADRKAERVTQ